MIDLFTIQVKKIAKPSKKAAADRFWRDVMSSFGHPGGNPADRRLRVVQSDVNQSRLVPRYFTLPEKRDKAFRGKRFDQPIDKFALTEKPYKS